MEAQRLQQEEIARQLAAHQVEMQSVLAQVRESTDTTRAQTVQNLEEVGQQIVAVQTKMTEFETAKTAIVAELAAKQAVMESSRARSRRAWSRLWVAGRTRPRRRSG